MGSLPPHPDALLWGGLLCITLSILFIVKVLIPGWRKKWGWGRGNGHPISIAGHVGISIAFLFISTGMLAIYYNFQSPIIYFLPPAGFVIFIISGMIDSLGK